LTPTTGLNRRSEKIESLLSIKNLSVEFPTSEGTVRAVKNISFDIPKGKTVGLVGESGSGKSVTCLAVMGIIPQNTGRVSAGEILFNGKNLLESKGQMRDIRGNRISMIFQDPMTSLNPLMTVGRQVMEPLMLHKKMNKTEARAETLELLKKVGMPQPDIKIDCYPHELSGGQIQRIMIAMALSCEPDLLIADEPTTALDVTIQKQILDLMLSLQKEYKMSILFITHDLGVVADICEEVLVMYKGDLVEKNTTKNLFANAKHPYTKGLIACRPDLEYNPSRLTTVQDYLDDNGNAIEPKISSISIDDYKKEKHPDSDVILELKNIKKYFPIRGGIFRRSVDWLKAVDDVSFKVKKGQTLGLVGESGCGKTTLGRTIVRLYEPTEGQVIFKGQDITNLSFKELQPLRKKIQFIFQNPYASLNPRQTIGEIITEPWKIHKTIESPKDQYDEAARLLDKVGLPPSHLSRYPHEFSGGQRQRICIARALTLKPELIICDESVSALDVSIQASVLNLLLDLQEEFGLTYIFISHDLSVVKFISDEVGVMNEGKLVEFSDFKSVYERPKEAYTRKLLDSIPKGIPN